MNKSSLTSKSNSILGGRTCIINSRVPVAAITSLSRMGVPATKIVEKHYPHLKVETIRRVLKTSK